MLEKLFDRKIMMNTPAAIIAMLGGTIAISYILWVISGCDPFFPFISDLDLHPWTTSLFTFGLTFSGFLLILLTIQIYSLRSEWALSHLSVNDKLLPLLNKIAFIPGVIAGIAVIGIAWAPWNEGIELHILLANGVFYSGVIWAGVITFSTWKMSTIDTKLSVLLRARIISALAAFIGLIGMIWKVGVAVKSGFDFESNEVVSTDFDTFCRGIGSSLGSDLLNQAALFEWLLAVGILFFIYTFKNEISLVINDENDTQ